MNNYERESVINSVGGNSMAYMLDKQREENIPSEDMYFCEDCASLVKYDEWNEENKQCKGCSNA